MLFTGVGQNWGNVISYVKILQGCLIKTFSPTWATNEKDNNDDIFFISSLLPRAFVLYVVL